MAEAEAANEPPPPYCTDEKMADCVMDFLFASQDASTASIVQMIVLMADHPDVFRRVGDGGGRGQACGVVADHTGMRGSSRPHRRVGQ